MLLCVGVTEGHAMKFEATAYGPPWDAMEGTGITSKGVKLKAGQQKLVVAVDPTVIPYGTKLKIWPNPFGDRNLVFTASDTGGAFQGGVRKVDFFVASGRKDQNRWGRRGVSVKVVGRGSPTDVGLLGEKVQRTSGVRASKVSRAGVTRVDPALRSAALQQYVSQRGRPDALLSLAQGLESAQQAVPSPVQATAAQTDPGPQASTSFAETARKRADIIDAKKLPYLWGGGHGGKVDPKKATPLDCSGAVSSVLGINPRVSGEFRHWGSPGRAPGGKGVTVYSNAEHVLMEIDGHFWGTSKANPGGGAGWIPRSKISAEYLRGFNVRHTKR